MPEINHIEILEGRSPYDFNSSVFFLIAGEELSSGLCIQGKKEGDPMCLHCTGYRAILDQNFRSRFHPGDVYKTFFRLGLKMPILMFPKRRLSKSEEKSLNSYSPCGISGNFIIQTLISRSS
jgi:hypothetical protein